MRNLALLVALSLLGCPKDEAKKPSEKSEEKAEKAEKKKDKADDDDSDEPKKKKKKKSDDGEEPSEKKKPAEEVKAPERTKTPTVAEWNAASDVKAAGNVVNCEVRAVREWVRVSCRKPSPGGGTPTAVVVERGKNKETFVYANKGIASVVTPLLPGTDLEAKFSWTDVVYAVRFAWKKTEPRPDVWAHFVKTDDPPTKPIGVATCECYKKVSKGKCDDSDMGWGMTSQNPWCEATFSSDCEKMVACGRSEPSAMPSCPSTHHLTYPGNYCVAKCKKDADCPKGHTCQSVMGDETRLGCFEDG
jgi:hypothetical protein